jgi:hypothetical protein
MVDTRMKSTATENSVARKLAWKLAWRWARRWIWRWAVPLLLAVGTAISLFSRFRAGNAFLVFFEDDYFYYLRVARNIAAGHGSTFDGTHLTNGYHPLWMVVNVVLAKLLTGRPFFYALLAVIFACVLATFFFTRLCLRRYAGEAAASACAGLIAVEGLQLMSGGMEIVLTIPLMAALCWYRVCRFGWRPGSAALYGLLCAAVVLSRLDTAIFVALLVLFELLAARAIPPAQKTRAALAFAAGLLPLAVYFAMNQLIFHTLMPVSGQAKQLRFSHAPSSLPFHGALLDVWPPLRFFLVIPVCFASLAAGLWLRRRPSRDPTHRPLIWALLAFPLAQLTVLSFVSDWPIWPWYLYPFVGAAIGVCLVLLSRGGTQTQESRIMRFVVPFALSAGVALLCIFNVVQWRNSKRPDKLIYSMYWGAQDIRAFAMTHPGVYAMGDRAGIAGQLVNQPIVQLEGLVMDKAFLDDMRQQRDLKQVLESYGVRYYICTNPKQVGACLRATEPMAAGPTSPVMRGTFCSPPLRHFLHSGFNTYIFDMKNERGHNP